MGKKIKILSWNVNGIRAVHRKSALQPLLEGENPHILCIQETKLSKKEDLPKDYHELGYEVYLSCAQEKKGYSGVAIFTSITPNSISEGIGIEEFDKEGRILRADFDDFILFSVYFPNGKMSDERLDYKMRFYDALEKVAQNLREQGHKVIICGDVNTAHKRIDLARPKQNETVSGFLPQEREWITNFLEKGWIDTLRMFDGREGLYTWWAMRAPKARENNVGWRLDYFYVNEEMKENLKNAYVLQEYKGSDHCPIGIDTEF